jgi:hypothetical protein
MRFAAAGLLAALLIAPLAAQAARPPVRFAVTLQASVTDRVAYDRRETATEDCTVRRTGSGGRTVTLRSILPTTVDVVSGRGRIAYRPSRISNVRAVAVTLGGVFAEMRACRFLPPEQRTGSCRASRPVTSTISVTFGRRGASRIGFGRVAPAPIQACGLEEQPLGGWLSAAVGSVLERALLAGSSWRAAARGSSRQRVITSGVSTLDATANTTVRWTLTFQRR